jgi:RHS repeat-associated protein
MILSAGTTNYTYDAADQLLTAGTSVFTYDGNGNQLTKTTSGTTVTYGWDAINRLKSVVGGTVNTQYQYDGDGNRISQIVPAGSYAYFNDTATAFPVVLSENGPDGSLDYAYGLSMISATSATFQYYYQFDGLGSTINITDPTGAQKANYAYDPWGKLTTPLDPLGTKEKYKFTGEASDPNSGLVFLRARYLDQTIGRFLSRDPLELLAVLGDSKYPYANGSPTQLVDHSGLWYSWSQVGQALRQTVSTLPSFALCGGGVLNVGTSCHTQGLSDAQIAFGSDIGKAVFTITTGNPALANKITDAVQYSIEGGELIYKGVQGHLTPQDLLLASEDVLIFKYKIDVLDITKDELNKSIISIITGGAGSIGLQGRPTK